MEVIGFIIQITGIALLIILVSLIPLWIFAKKRNRFNNIDYALVLLPSVFLIITSIFETLNITAKSLSNLFFELAIYIFAIVVGYGLKIFLPNLGNNQRKNSIVLLIALFFFAIIFTLLMPLLPE